MKEAIRAIPLLPEEKQKEPEPQAATAPEPQREEPAPRPQVQQAAPEPPRPAPAPAAQPAQAGDTAAALSAFVEAARGYAFALRTEDPANYLAWQLPRVALWGKITALPPDDGTGQTMVPAARHGEGRGCRTAARREKLAQGRDGCGRPLPVVPALHRPPAYSRRGSGESRPPRSRRLARGCAPRRRPSSDGCRG